MSAYTVRYTRTSYHIAGIAEATKASADGMSYALSACPSLSRSGSRMAVGPSFDDLKVALAKAEMLAKNRRAKMCAACKAAAERQS